MPITCSTIDDSRAVVWMRDGKRGYRHAQQVGMVAGKRRYRYARQMLQWALVAALWLAVAGCQKPAEQDPEPQMPPPIAASEAERGVDACQAYVDRVCACAKAKPENAELADQCHMAPAKSKSLQMVLEVNQAPKDAKERVVTGQTARRIIASCIEAQGSLDSLGCSR